MAFIGLGKARLRAICLLLILAFNGVALANDSLVGQEYSVKVAFLYNFIRFTDWPKDKLAQDAQPFIIGIVGKDPFGKTADVIARKSVKGKPIVVRRFTSLAEVPEDGFDRAFTEIKQCHLVFVASTEREYWPRLLPTLREASIMTVSEVKGFLEAGGMINFVTEGTKGRFEIHLKNTRQARLDIRAKLLRLAKEVKGK